MCVSFGLLLNAGSSDFIPLQRDVLLALDGDLEGIALRLYAILDETDVLDDATDAYGGAAVLHGDVADAHAVHGSAADAFDGLGARRAFALAGVTAERSKTRF